MQKRNPAREYMSPHFRDSQHSGAGVTDEQIAGVRVDPGCFGNGLLGDEVEPVIPQSRAQLFAGVSGRKLDVEAYAQGRKRVARRFLMKFPLQSQVSVARASRTGC